jgi:hypothetical protein
MTALTKDTNRVYELGNINELPVAAGEVIYQGAAIGCDASGYAKTLEYGDTFAGFSEENCDNAAGSDGAKNVRLRKRGSILLEISGITLADVNKVVYATDDNTFTLSSTNAVYIGKISRIDSSGLAVVDFAPPLAS